MRASLTIIGVNQRKESTGSLKIRHDFRVGFFDYHKYVRLNSKALDSNQ